MFSITDNNYGITEELQRCSSCGFIQASRLKDVLSFYEDMKDTEYDKSRRERSIQARKILLKLKKYCPKGRLLDVGAGIGILVEQARKLGYRAEGIEPSKWLQSKAKKNNLTVYLGTLPHPKVTGTYNIVCIVDVLEHVSEPMNLLLEIKKVLSRDGIAVIITPDLGSIMARVLGFKWWHFRIAHVGYYSKKTLETICDKVDLKLIKMCRPSWYFSLDYITRRINRYLPRIVRLPVFSFSSKITIPVNLRDSILGIFILGPGHNSERIPM